MKSKFTFYSITICAIFVTALFTTNDAEAACAEPSAGGTYTISTSCTFDTSLTGGIHGADNGGITINSGQTLTINAAETIVWSPGFPLIINGSIALNSTAKLQQTRMWVVDADADGYPDSRIFYLGLTAPSNATSTRSVMATTTVVDAYPTNPAGYQSLNCFTDADGDGYAASTTVTFNVVAADDGQVRKESTGWPPSGGDSVSSVGTDYYAENSKGTANFIMINGLVRWDTESLPNNATVSSAIFRPYVMDLDNPGGVNYTGEWYNHGGIDITDWSSTVVANAFAAVALSAITAGADKDFTLINLSNISLTGYTGIRTHIDGGQPPHTQNRFNSIHVAAQEHASLTEARLLVTYTVPVATVSGATCPTGTAATSLGADANDSNSNIPVATCAVGTANNPNGTCTATFYPDANVETTSVDGHVERLDGGADGVAYATIHDGAGTAAWPSADTIDFGNINAGNVSGRWRGIGRTILVFDTSSLPDGATKNSATLEFVGTLILQTVASQSLSLVGSTPASNTDLVAADYAQLNTIKQASDLTLASLVADSATYNAFTLNSTGLASISLTTVTKFGTRLLSDLDNVAPTWSSGQPSGLIRGASADELLAGDKRPKLVVTYSP